MWGLQKRYFKYKDTGWKLKDRERYTMCTLSLRKMV